MRVAIADNGRRSRDSSLIGNAAPAPRLTGQNVRGSSQLKLEKVVQFMKEQRLGHLSHENVASDTTRVGIGGDGRLLDYSSRRDGEVV